MDHSSENTGCKSFNYCFWAKLLVAIPAIPLVAALVASWFTDPLLQVAAAVVTIGLMVCLAIKIDRLPCLAGKVVKPRPGE